VQCSAVQCSAVQFSTVQFSTVQYSTVQYSAVQYSTVQYSTVQYTFTHKTVHRTTQLIQEECWPCPVFAGYTLAFALQLRKKVRKNLSQGSRRVPVGHDENRIYRTEHTEQ
jgi:hypothetical protein